MKNRVLYLLASAFLFLMVPACREKDYSEPDVIILAENPLWVSGEDIFSQSRMGLPSKWIWPGDRGIMMFGTGSGPESRISYRDYMDKPPLFPVNGMDVEGHVTLSMPTVPQEQSIPFTIILPFIFRGTDIPEDLRTLSWFRGFETGNLSLWFDDDCPMTHVIADLEIDFPSGSQMYRGGENMWFCADQEDESIGRNSHAYLYAFNEELSHPGHPSFPWSVVFYCGFDMPDSCRDLPGRSFQVDSTFTLRGVLHVDPSMVKEGAAWPGEITLRCAFSAQGKAISIRGKVNDPSEFSSAQPSITFLMDDDHCPSSFLDKASVPNLYDNRLFLEFTNRSPYTVWLTGTLEGRKGGSVVFSQTFGEQDRILSTLNEGDDEYPPAKQIVFSEYGRFPYDFSSYADDQEHVSLHMDGLSHLLDALPDEIRIVDWKVCRDPEEEVEIDWKTIPVWFSLRGKMSAPYQAGSGYQLVFRHDATVPAFQSKDGRQVNLLTLEGTLQSSLPLNVECLEVSAEGADPWHTFDVHVTWDSAPLKPAIDGSPSSQIIRLQTESPYDLSGGLLLHFTFRLFADEDCQGVPLTKDMSLCLSDVRLLY